MGAGYTGWGIPVYRNGKGALMVEPHGSIGVTCSGRGEKYGQLQPEQPIMA